METLIVGRVDEVEHRLQPKEKHVSAKFDHVHEHVYCLLGPCIERVCGRNVLFCSSFTLKTSDTNYGKRSDNRVQTEVTAMLYSCLKYIVLNRSSCPSASTKRGTEYPGQRVEEGPRASSKEVT